MAHTSPSLVHRFNDVAGRSSRLSLSTSPAQPPAEFQLQQLEPRPISLQRCSIESPRSFQLPFAPVATQTGGSPEPERKERENLDDSYPRRKPKILFHGPPPPIAESVMAMESTSNPSSYKHAWNQEGSGLMRIMGRSISQVIFDRPQRRNKPYNHRADSIWRSLQRREQTLELDIQQLLDFQAEGLVAGSQPEAKASSDIHGAYSDTGSSTPTGTFYSTVTSRSQMLKSLYMPPQSTSNGDLIPVRQPAEGRPPGLRAARSGLRKAMESFVELRREERKHIMRAMEERRAALHQLESLSTRRFHIQSELEAFDVDGEEPLGRELRELKAKYASVDKDIKALEDKLVGLRNQRRWLEAKMKDVEGKREAGLSGYRGALGVVDSEVSLLVRQPPVLPLDQGLHDQSFDTMNESQSRGGEFLSLVPEHRTPDMAKSWWEAEMATLKRRIERVDADQKALEEGIAVWNGIVAIISRFENEFRDFMRADRASPLSAMSIKGKENVTAEVEVIQKQLTDMRNILIDLEHAMNLAESNGWNLLICAIGAELEAFREAHHLLMAILPQSTQERERTDVVLSNEKQNACSIGRQASTSDGSDNDVPLDLLMSHLNNTHCHSRGDEVSVEESRGDETRRDRAQSQDSENEVPLEFLAEHE